MTDSWQDKELDRLMAKVDELSRVISSNLDIIVRLKSQQENIRIWCKNTEIPAELRIEAIMGILEGGHGARQA